MPVRTGWNQWLLHRIMDAGIIDDRMNTRLVELGKDVLRGHIAVVAGITVLLLSGIVEQALPSPCSMWIVATLAGVRRNRLLRGVRPGIRGRPIPCLCGGSMASLVPILHVVARNTQRGCRVVHHEKTGVPVVVRVVA